MNEQLVSQIEELGLSNKEARVYVACLTLGASPVQKIADQAGIKRVTAYVILESLVSLGLVSQSVKGKKTLFNAEEPSNLRRLLEKREQEIKEQKANFDHMLPDLNALKLIPKDSPNVRFYDSPEGIRSIVATFMEVHRKDTDYIFGVSNLNQLFAFFPEFREVSSNPERLRAGVPSRLIYTHDDGPVLKSSDIERKRESRWVPADKYPLSGDFNVMGDYIVMLSLSGTKPIGITIESRELALGLLAVFELAWVSSAPYNKPE